MTNVILPESLKFYFASPQHQSAVQQILDCENIPNGLSWYEVEQYSIAKVSASTTQLEYWQFLNIIWGKVWKPSIENTRFNHEVEFDFYEDEYSLEYVWEEFLLYKTFDLNKSHWLYLFVGTVDESIKLGFYIRNKEDDTFNLSDNLELSELWLPTDDDTRWTTDNIVTINGNQEIDVSKLA